ncbi:MAG: AAA family ATPase [Actinobacteria bacterium]|nr:AAA family ATPase [Actinomycetota bacterium]
MLDNALARSRAGLGSAVFILGEAGIGKSRLSMEATGRAVAERTVVMRGRASTLGPGVPFRPITEALLSLLRRGISPTDKDLGPYLPALGRLVPEWAISGTANVGGSLIVLAEAILRLTAAVGDETGCLIVLEDLHDADLETLAVVEYLCDNLEHQPTMLLATMRTEQGAALDLARSAELRHAGTSIELTRLGRDATHELVVSCLGAGGCEVPAAVSERLWHDSAGVPFVVEELLFGMVSGGKLVQQSDGGWRLLDTGRHHLPSTLVRSIGQRTERLGPQGKALLSVAAVLGRQFSLTVVQTVLDVDDHLLLSHLHAAVEAQLIAPDERGPDWYAFQHPLTVDALLGQLTPADRAELARRAADAAEAQHPDLEDDWCQLVAMLRMNANDHVAAARLLTEAGRRALASGAAGSAVALLDRAERLLVGADDPVVRAQTLETLLYALAECGEFDRAFTLADAIDDRTAGIDTGHRIALHVRLAWTAHLAGRWSDGANQLAAARALLTRDTTARDTAAIDAAAIDAAAIDAVAAYLALDGVGPDRLHEAETLAHGLVHSPDAPPLAKCQGWHVLGVVARERDLAEAHDCFDHARRIAEEHQLPIWRLYATLGLAGNAWLRTSDLTALESARDTALRSGAITLAQNIEATIAMHHVLVGDFDAAAARIDACLRTVERLRITSVARYLHMTRAALAAHRGRREEMEQALVRFREHGGDQSQELTLAYGLATAFCALLREDRALGAAELDRVVAAEAERPTTYHLAGSHGLCLLLGVLDGSVDWARFRETTAEAPASMRWNHQFVLLAEAVLLGRDGHLAEATDAAARAQGLAAPYGMARHLGLRLVARTAHDDGWGDPVAWLRSAEEYFHRAEVPAVASACRTLLRQFGVPLRQRRTGTDRVPVDLRTAGVTIREFEVFEVLADRLSNKAVAGRMHISPRTVEKHVANLIVKTRSADRAALVEYAWSTMAAR